MSGIGAIQAVNAAETWQAWLQANSAETQAAEQAETAPEQAPITAPAPAPLAPITRPADMPVPAPQLADAASALLPMSPVLLQPLSLQNGPELRWRVQDAAAWRTLFDDAGGDAPPQEQESPPEPSAPATEAMPTWAQALLDRLREAAATPASAAALRPALQAWRVGLPVLLASPAGLASLQPSLDASTWQWRRWPARWRTARPATAERWWAVRLALGTQGRPRTLRDLTGGLAFAPGQVSCELRLEDVAPGIAQWTEVLVQAPASASLRALLGTRPSLSWLLCNQVLWPREST
ncbi:hypothetical protein J2X20_003586 [Pelomonas saccharophila]|uniref:Uncharacterized protein n=1 Tax=Roseateles saccharophilus TaxID=304 RepID=A0ABU1YQA9_ROSSA|nr:hypothetical protein [Roseateles saccharophilus]MDR7270928.1 hypothetical protein [Roseateles saccharophilus]